jgi:ABC-type amino acid transport substrate-binding protein
MPMMVLRRTPLAAPVAALLTTAWLALATCMPLAHAQAPDCKKVRVGVAGNCPPFSRLGADGKLSGLDIDVIVASKTISEKRKKGADFSDPCGELPSRRVATAGAFKDASAASLKGKTIIALRKRDEVNAALKSLRANGSDKKLADSCFDFVASGTP